MRPTLRPQGRNPRPASPDGGSPARPASGREARGFVLGGIPPPVLARLGASAQTLCGSRRWAGVAASLAQPRPPLLSGAGVGARLSPALFATSRLTGGSGSCRVAPLQARFPGLSRWLIRPPSRRFGRRRPRPLPPSAPAPRLFRPSRLRWVWGCAVSRRCKPAKPGFFGAAGSPPLRRGVLPPLVLGFALPPFAPPSRGVGALSGAGSPCVLRVGCRVPPGALALRASGGRALRAPGLCGGLRPRFLRPAPALFRRVPARGDACRGWPGVFLCRSGWRGCVPRLGVVPLRAGVGQPSAANVRQVVPLRAGAGQLCAPHSVRKGGVYAPLPPAPLPVGRGERKADGLPCGGYHGGAGLSRASGLAGACAPLDTPFPHDVWKPSPIRDVLPTGIKNFP